MPEHVAAAERCPGQREAADRKLSSSCSRQQNTAQASEKLSSSYNKQTARQEEKRRLACQSMLWQQNAAQANKKLLTRS
eukprot:gene23040-30235_t